MSVDNSRGVLQDILPEDLFPPVSFSISERDDEDMPYTRPPKPASEPSPKPSSSKTTPPAASAAADDTLRPGRRRETENGTGNADEPPLALTSVENASIAVGFTPASCNLRLCDVQISGKECAKSSCKMFVFVAYAIVEHIMH